jgi:chromosome segregation ATPase
VVEVEARLLQAQADSDALRTRLAESERLNSELTARAAAPGKTKKKGDFKSSAADSEQKLQIVEKERAELEKLAILSERDRSNLAARLGRLEQELVDQHNELDRETRLRQQLSAELTQARSALALREQEETAGSARAEQLEELLLLTEKELFQRQRQYNEEQAKVESMADHFRQNRLDRENLETRIQLLSRDKAESHRLIREQERQIRLLKHDLEFFKPDRLVDSAEIRLADLPQEL